MTDYVAEKRAMLARMPRNIDIHLWHSEGDREGLATILNDAEKLLDVVEAMEHLLPKIGYRRNHERPAHQYFGWSGEGCGHGFSGGTTCRDVPIASIHLDEAIAYEAALDALEER